MKDIPLFNTDSGVGSLILKELPYTGSAYIIVHDSNDPQGFIKHCVDFCKAVGATKIFASGHDYLTCYPLYTDILKMRRLRDGTANTTAYLLPVNSESIDDFRNIYNQKMFDVPMASYMTIADAKRILENRTGYFAYREEVLLGIGVAAGSEIRAMASIVSGAGSDILFALSKVLSHEMIELEVASANDRALRLYKRLAFETVSNKSSWYKINL